MDQGSGGQVRGDIGDAGAVSDGEEGSGVASAWKLGLRQYLAEHMDSPPVEFGQLFDAFQPLVPRHEVERHWRRTHQNDDEMVAPNRKFQTLLTAELQRYPLEVFGTERARGKAWTRETLIRAIARPCRTCGSPYVAYHKNICCSHSCGNRLRHIAPQDQHLPAVTHNIEELTMAPSKRHPELVAIETVFETLKQFPDQATRDRVMTYAKHLLESEPEPKPFYVVNQDTAAD